MVLEGARPVIYLSGVVRPALRHPSVGWMLTPDTRNRPPAHGYFAIDNACFASPEAFRWERYARFIERTYDPERCLFVAAPDVPFDAEGTLQRFEQYRPEMPAAVRVALVTQDGMGVEDVPWARVDAVFVGGTTTWKTGHESQAIVTAARDRGKWVHMGRVNSLRRLRVAASMGCDSVDGTFLKRAPDHNEARMLRWLASLEREPLMVLG